MGYDTTYYCTGSELSLLSPLVASTLKMAKINGEKCNKLIQRAHIPTIIQKWMSWLDKLNFQRNLYQGTTERQQVRNSTRRLNLPNVRSVTLIFSKKTKFSNSGDLIGGVTQTACVAEGRSSFNAGLCLSLLLGVFLFGKKYFSSQ